jgi:hypothetical protein
MSEQRATVIGLLTVAFPLPDTPAAIARSQSVWGVASLNSQSPSRRATSTGLNADSGTPENGRCFHGLRWPPRIPIAGTHLLESAPRECFTGAHENMPHLPAYLPGRFLPLPTRRRSPHRPGHGNPLAICGIPPAILLDDIVNRPRRLGWWRSFRRRSLCNAFRGFRRGD